MSKGTHILTPFPGNPGEGWSEGSSLLLHCLLLYSLAQGEGSSYFLRPHAIALRKRRRQMHKNRLRGAIAARAGKRSAEYFSVAKSNCLLEYN